MKNKLIILITLIFSISGYTQKIGSIDAEDMPITKLIRLLSENNDINIIPSAKSRSIKINIFLKNIDALVALEEICNSHNLWIDKNPETKIYRIYTLDEYKKNIAKFSEQIKVFDLKYPNSKVISKAIFELFPSRVIYFETSRQNMDEDIEDIENRLEKLEVFEEQNFGSNENGQNNSNIRLLDSQRNNDRNNDRNNSNFNNQNGSGGQGPRNIKLPEKPPEEKLNMTSQTIHKINAAESIEEIKKIINDQDIVKNSRIYLSSILNKNQMVIRTSDIEALEKITKLVTELDKPNPMVLLEMKILAVTLDKSFESAFDMIYSDGTNTITLNPGVIQSNGALTYSRIDSKFNTALTLLEKNSKIRTLATPVILTLNREVSKFFTGNQGVPILTGFQNNNETIVNNNTTITTLPTPVYENRDLGTTLKVSPTINSNKTVQLQISSIESELDVNSATVLVPSGSTFIAQAIDTEKRRSFTGTVLAHDAKMIAVGGIIKESQTEIDAGVPILKDIPLLSYIFEDKQEVTVREEIILLIRPYIIYSEDDYKNLSKDLLKRMSKHPNANTQKDELNKKK